jgi:LruC domain-containing protein
MKTINLATIVLIIFSLSCQKVTKDAVEVTAPESVTDINLLKVPSNFDYQTSNEISFSIQLLTNDDKPIKNVRIDIMDGASDLDGSKIIVSGSTDNFGVFSSKVEVPSYLTKVVVNSDYIGIPNDVLLDLVKPATSLTLGGKSPMKIVTAQGKLASGNNVTLSKSTDFSYRLGSWELVQGKPNYLFLPREVITSSFLADVNTSLPERRKVPIYNPGYLNNTVERNLKITQLSDIWITFVHEGAGFRNSLFYYVYNKNNPPQTRNDIDSLICVFPNASYLGSGGGLVSGDKVLIGRFGADTVVGFAISSDGYRSSGIQNSTIFLSDKDLNVNESNPLKKEHSVLFYDNTTDRFLIAFEDQLRTNGSSDEDFNDVVFFAKANPVTGIDTKDVLPIKNFSDIDNDGIADDLDDYPNDATKAHNNIYPSIDEMATIVFEDQWPSKGDYDLNDLVVDYRYNVITNAENNVVKVIGRFKPRAAGGVYKNAFGVEFPTSRGNVKNMIGATLETGQSKAVAILFNNSRKKFNNAFNTKDGEAYQNVDTMDISFELNSPISLNSFSLGSFNPFIFVDEAGKGRGFEIHLAGKTPTDLANSAIFGTSSDGTSIANGVYYKTKNNLPYAINVPKSFPYLKEKNSIISGYLHFATWATSGGSLKTDWYLNNNGYRQTVRLY